MISRLKKGDQKILLSIFLLFKKISWNEKSMDNCDLNDLEKVVKNESMSGRKKEETRLSTNVGFKSHHFFVKARSSLNQPSLNHYSTNNNNHTISNKNMTASHDFQKRLLQMQRDINISKIQQKYPFL